MSTRSVVIIGSGPAGLTAALYSARANLQPLVIEGLEAGGQLMITTLVENWPGHRDGVMGPELMAEMRAQAQKFGAEIVHGHVTAVDLSARPFTVRTDDTEYKANAVIVATGASSRLLGLPSERALMGHGVSTCATCDGYFFRGHEIAVVGGGDSAMEEGTYLTKFASTVHIIHRRDQLRASRIMAERAQKNPKIKFHWNKAVIDVLGDHSITGLRLKDTKTNKETELPVGGLFVAIGHTPATAFLDGQLELDAKKYIKFADPARSTTSVEGVFAAGDCADSVYRQAVTAAGMGCKAALDAERWLAQQGIE
jgi:thioredoxin reductase (NADPH)